MTKVELERARALAGDYFPATPFQIAHGFELNEEEARRADNYELAEWCNEAAALMYAFNDWLKSQNGGE